MSVRALCWMGKESPQDHFTDSRRLDYSDLPVVDSNGFVSSVYKTSDSFGENNDASRLLLASLGRDELHDKISLPLASQNTVKDNQELSDKLTSSRCT